jgi:hypothetical protein
MLGETLDYIRDKIRHYQDRQRPAKVRDKTRDRTPAAPRSDDRRRSAKRA